MPLAGKYRLVDIPISNCLNSGILERPFEYYLILSGDQLYSMDYRDLTEVHLRTGADMTLSTTRLTVEPLQIWDYAQ